LFHYGHLMLLRSAKEEGTIHICGLLSDEVCNSWHGNLIMNYKEREAVLKSIDCVDNVMLQNSIDPTENLKKIHEEYPDYEIILFQGHQNWKGMPGSHFIHSINGKIVKPPYYPRLSRNFIKDELNRSNDNHSLDFDGYILGDFQLFAPGLSTKANTLERLKPLLKKSTIEKLFVFTKKLWLEASNEIVKEIQLNFEQKIVIRSSTKIEDSLKSSYAGFFTSELNIDVSNQNEIIEGVESVIKSYSKHKDESESDQILVQNQTEEVMLSGVLFTRNLKKNAPYYLINYDVSSDTEAVTSGNSACMMEISRDTILEDIPWPWRNLLESIHEIEGLLDRMVLDIEFAIRNNGSIVIFQVRPLAANIKFATQLSDETLFNLKDRVIDEYRIYSKHQGSGNAVLSDMAFWNPAEIIGDRSLSLAYSLYRKLILQKAWNQGLISLGYPEINQDLIVRVCNKSYIDVRLSFEALLPAALGIEIKNKLIDFYLSKLQSRPELHDKIEFQIVHNAFTPNTENELNELKEVLTQNEIETFSSHLKQLTQNVFNNYNSFLKEDEGSVEKLSQQIDRVANKLDKSNVDIYGRISLIKELIQGIIENGTVQFSRIARCGFISNKFLSDLAVIGIITEKEKDAILNSFSTVASDFESDAISLRDKKISWADFSKKYGHLRPGTYDINKLPYSMSKNYFMHQESTPNKNEVNETTGPIKIEKSIEKIEAYLNNFSIDVEASSLFSFIESSTVNREYFKFQFTKGLSLILEQIANICSELVISREDAAHLSIENIITVDNNSTIGDIKEMWRSQIEGRKLIERQNQLISLPSIIFDERDFQIVNFFVTKPNFISEISITEEIIDVDLISSENVSELSGKIVVVEKADPGYDWIFSKGIKGLITKFGGAASHMAIRCAEFGIPAAIGCGEVIYQELKGKTLVQLDCKRKKIQVIY